MDMIQIVIFGIIASVLYIVLKDTNGTFSFVLLLVTGIAIFLSIFQQIGIVFQMIYTLGERASIEGMYLETILKIIGIAYIAELGSNIVKDAGLESVATKIELAGKIFILILAVPIITAVVDTILSFLPTA